MFAAACGGAAPQPAQPESTAVAAPPSAEPVATPASSADSAPASAPAQAQAPAKAEPDGPVGDPMVKVIASGADPKSALRYTPKAGQKLTMNMVMAMGMTVKLGDKESPPVSLPKMSSDLVMTVTNVAPDGMIAYDFAITSAKAIPGKGVKPEVLKQVDEQFGKMTGLKGHATVDSRGVTRDLSMDVPSGIDDSVRDLLDSMRQSMRQMANPFPAEPVGVGAKWDTEQRIRIKGMLISQVTHSTLKKLKGQKLSLDIELEQSADSQPVQLPAAAAGATAKLITLKSHGTGTLDGDLGRIAPTKSHLDLDSHTQMQISQGSDTMPLATDMTMKIELKSR